MKYKGNEINLAAAYRIHSDWHGEEVEVEYTNDYIEFNGKRVKIIENNKYTYKFNKASISAQGGAAGLIEFMNECINEKFGLVWVDAIIEKMQRIAKEW